MSAAGGPHYTHAPHSDIYDPDDVLPPQSPGLQPHRVTLKLSPTPPLIYPPTVHPSQGDAVLVNILDGGRRPEIGIQAGLAALPSDIDSAESPPEFEELGSPGGRSVSPAPFSIGGHLREDGRARDPEVEADPDKMALDDDALISLAAGALAVASPPAIEVDAGPTPPVTENDVVGERFRKAPSFPQAVAVRPIEPGKEDRSLQPPLASPYSPQSPGFYSPRQAGVVALHPMHSPPIGLGSSSRGEGLAPLQLNSPRSDSGGQTSLPSLKQQLGDINQLAHNHAADNDRFRQHSFPHSPPNTLGSLASIHPGSPPISPNYPHQAMPNLGYAYQRSPHDYPSSTTATPSSEQSGSTPATSIADNVHIEGLTIQSASAIYRCTFEGCTAAPFQTQYLLNSHANVHSSSRPHYCPVATCPRSEGGKGFKRKNEMIRHGLVHDSPGYVCPFCPDREHKYPRPDNLQRHVRVHHVDKDKDDPLLREVLAQRPDGPSRGRRRRGQN